VKADDQIKIVAPAWAVWTATGALIVLALGMGLVAVQAVQQMANSAAPATQAFLSPLSTPATLAATVTPTGLVAVSRANNAELRAAPGAGGTLLGLVLNGSRLVVRARTADNQWLRVETDDGAQGWLPVGAVDLRGASMAQVPPSALAPLPPPTPVPPPPTVPPLAPTSAQPLAPTVASAASLVGLAVRVLDAAPVREAGALNLRAARDTGSALVDKAQAGELLTVLGRVAEGDGLVWLLVRSPRNKEGWVREKDGNTLLVALPGQEPPAPPAAPAATAPVKPTVAAAATAAPAATGAAPSGPVLYNVKVLDTQVVRGAGALNLRAQRDTTTTVVDSAAIGEALAVYERVVEANGTPWLRVRSPRGKEGWVREKDGETALVERMQ